MEKKFVEGRVRLRTLFDIKLDNVSKLNVTNGIKGKIESRVKDKSQA